MWEKMKPLMLLLLARLQEGNTLNAVVTYGSAQLGLHANPDLNNAFVQILLGVITLVVFFLKEGGQVQKDVNNKIESVKMEAAVATVATVNATVDPLNKKVGELSDALYSLKKMK
jgi:hypothetical protein